MIITRIHISAFGKLKNFTMDFSEGFQVVYGENEFGKSTIMEFIKIMFYSRRGGIKAGADDKAVRNKYCPWDTQNMGGTIEFIHNECEYRLQKELHPATPSRDKILLQNRTSGQTISLGKNEEVGQYIFGLDLKGFERSGYIGRVGKAELSDIKSEDSLSARIISNLFDTGDESISANTILSRIDDAKAELQKPRSGKIKVLEDKLVELQKELTEIQIYEDQQLKYKQELLQKKSLFEEKLSIQKRINIFEKAKKIENLKMIINLIEQKQQTIDSIKSGDLSLDQIENIIQTCESKLQNINSRVSSLAQLKEIVKSDIQMCISDQEYNNVKNWIAQSDKYKLAFDKINDNLLPQAERISKQILLCDEINKEASSMQENINRLSDIRNDLMRLNLEKDQKNQQKKELLRMSSSDSFNLDGEKSNLDLREKDFNLFLEKGNKIIIASGVLALISLLIAASLGQWFIAAVFPVLFVLCCLFVGVIKNKNKKSISEIKNRISDLEKQISIKYTEPLKKLDDYFWDINQKIDNLNEQERIFLKIENDYNLKQAQLYSQIENLNQLKDSFNSQKTVLFKTYIPEEIIDNFKDINDYFDKSNITRLAENLKERYSLIQEKIKTVFDKYDCISEEDFKERYLLENTNKETINKINQIKSNIQKLKTEFIEKIKLYSNTDDFSIAVSVFNKLKQDFYQAKKKINDIQIRVESSEFKEFSLTELKERLKCCMSEINGESLNFDDINQMTERLDFLQKQDLDYQIACLKNKITPLKRSLTDVQTEISEIKQKISDMKKYFDALTIASQVMNSAYDEIRNRFGPQLDKRVSEIFSDFTGGKYDKLYVQKDYKIFVQTAGVDKETSNLSSATIDQAYLSLRIAVSELISKNGCYVPFLLDDSFMQYDDKRLHAAISYLKRYSLQDRKEFQIILFTCHYNVLNCASQNGLNIVK